jgi:hypothetical protein
MPMRGLGSAMLSAIVLGSAACSAPLGEQRHYCTPAPGMGTDQLAACGCVMHKTGSLTTTPESRDQGGLDMQTVIIVNYLCPLGEQGVAFVSVVNGVADRVYY